MHIEKIFKMKPYKGVDYRVVCTFGDNNHITYAWWGYLQQKVKYKKYLLFGDIKEKWIEINRCWWSTDITNLKELKSKATKLYDENVCLGDRLYQEAINLK